jgi:hypothetical protein
MFFASSSEELALVRLITEPVVPLPMLFWEVFSDCALVIPCVDPIKMIDNSIRIDRKFFIIKMTATNYLMIQDFRANGMAYSTSVK